jgi:uncharacterized protein HemY
MFEESLRVWRAADFSMGVAYAISSLGRVASRSRDFERAAERYQEARDIFLSMAADPELVDTDARIAEALVLQGMPDETVDLASDALRRSAAQDGAEQPMLLRILGYAHAQRREWDHADANFRASLNVARARDARFEAALTLDAIARVAAARGYDAPQARNEADAIFTSLDVVNVPAVPLQDSPVDVDSPPTVARRV